MAEARFVGRGDAASVASWIDAAVLNSGISCEKVGSATESVGGVTVITMVYEKYYWRAGNRASLTVVLVGCQGETRVHAIGAGGGQGPIFRFSWGAEDHFVGVVAQTLEGHGFRQG